MGASNFGSLDLATAYYVFAETQEYEGFKCTECDSEIHSYEIPEDTEGFTCPYCEESQQVPEEKDFKSFYHTPEMWDVEDELDYFVEKFKEFGVISTDTKNYNNLATFVSNNKEYAGVDISLYFEVHIETGYHDGARLDFRAYLEGYSSNYHVDKEELFERISDLMHNDTDCSDKVIALRAKQASKWAKKEFERMVNHINKALEEAVPTKLRRVGSFSNGETVYEKL